MATEKKLTLHDIKAINPRAYEQYCEMLAEDCQDVFTIDEAGVLHSVTAEDPPIRGGFHQVWEKDIQGGVWNDRHDPKPGR